MAATDLRALITERIERFGPMTFATFMELSLYHPRFGFYARASRQTGRAGHFFTSVDVGPLFGELLAEQFAEMWALIGSPPTFDLVEAGAANGQLARDVLDALAAAHPDAYRAAKVVLVEASAAARTAQIDMLAAHRDKVTRAATLPDHCEGILFANELLDALPCHIVTANAHGELREIGVALQDGSLVEHLMPPSTPELAEHLERLGARLAPGSRVEVNLKAVAWVRDAARRLGRGFLMLVDYGHPSSELYSATHQQGTLASFRRHHMVAGDTGWQEWLNQPGEFDLTTHVDLTSVEHAATIEGLKPLARLDQTYFLLSLALPGFTERSSESGPRALKRRLALKTLMLPGGLGSTEKVLIFGRDVGTPSLRGCTYGARLT